MIEPLRVLVVDDEKISRRTMVQQLRAAGYYAAEAENGYAGLDQLAQAEWDVLVTDLRMPGLDGIELMRQARARRLELEVVVMTAYGSVATAVTAMQEGAADYLTKPFSFAELEVRLRRIAQARSSRLELSRLRAIVTQQKAAHGILGACSAIAAIHERIRLFAASAAPVLVTGETGTGKELVSLALHASGPRSAGPFVPVACGAIVRELAESELFGHERGAFTGAVARHLGCFERASGGTLLLDDVDDLPLESQVKLLRVLQEGTLRRVGGHEDVTVDVRVVATTKVGLDQAVAAGRFRKDLFYRVRGLELALPPLRERGDDVLLLAQHFLERLAASSSRRAPRLTPEAAQALRHHSWPGNVRELSRAMESAVVLCAGDELRVEHLPDFLRSAAPSDAPYSLHLEGQTGVALGPLVERFEDEVVQWAMQQAQGQQSRAAELLGVPRTTLQNKLSRAKGK